MPTYSFRNTETDEEWDEFFTSNGKKEEFLKENPHIVQFINQAPALHSGSGLGVRRVDNGFRDLLNGMKNSKSLPGNTIKT